MKLRILIVVSLVFIFSCLVYLFYLILPLSDQENDRWINIPQGASVYHISKLLEKEKIIRSSSAFYYLVRMKGKETLLRAGTFRLSSSMTLFQIMHALEEGKGVQKHIKILLKEGLTLREMDAIFSKKGFCEVGSFYAYTMKEAKNELLQDFPFLENNPVETLEGYLFPDTYFFPENYELKLIVKTLLKNFEKQILPLWKDDLARKGSPKSRFSFHQVMTVASMIQKEAGYLPEMPLISSVFYNRLKKRMPLASDPTVVYALGKSHKERVYYKDLKIDSPYNTYKYSGFPPSPIAGFGKRAFEASLSPEKSSYYFFVASSGGRHHFSETYEEHLSFQRRIKRAKLSKLK